MNTARAQRADQAFLKLQALRPQLRLERGRGRLAALQRRLAQAMDQALAARAERGARLLRRLDQQHPRRRLQEQRHRLQLLGQTLARAPRRLLEPRQLRLAGLARALAGVSPLATLARGYSILREDGDGPVVRRAAQVQPGDRLEARLAEGRLRLRVEPDAD
jgi:exodeoxyribonuclease VII large subunit